MGGGDILGGWRANLRDWVWGFERRELTPKRR